MTAFCQTPEMLLMSTVTAPALNAVTIVTAADSAAVFKYSFLPFLAETSQLVYEPLNTLTFEKTHCSNAKTHENA
ncbi:hypothetical protein C1J03_21725 [Sulfitobacter sp. SK012]|nr:hypothetical protein C1J03_21725 [Sulfitobacter sp. SK012]